MTLVIRDDIPRIGNFNSSLAGYNQKLYRTKSVAELGNLSGTRESAKIEEESGHPIHNFVSEKSNLTDQA
jgi:hypothetical protein